MKRVLLAMAMLVLSTATAFAAEGATVDLSGMQGMQGDSPLQEGMAAGGPGMQGGMPGCNKMVMMHNPEKVLMMAYHQNVVTFGKALEKMARQRERVPPEFARTALAEMRRSVEQIEKYRAGALAGMPAEMKGGDMQKMMDEHLVNVKTQLRELDELAKSDTISSKEVLKHLEALFHDCNGTSCKPPRAHGMPEGKCHPGMQDGKMSDCQKRGPCGHGCGHEGEHNCGHDGRHDCGECREHSGLMLQHHQMMLGMAQKMKAQDAELQKMVDKMQKAPKSKKADQLAAIVAKMVKQRAEMTAQMEKMQNHHHPGGAHAPCMEGGGHEADGEGMDMGDMKMQEE